jgi:hypothetical protein
MRQTLLQSLEDSSGGYMMPGCLFRPSSKYGGGTSGNLLIPRANPSTNSSHTDRFLSEDWPG